MTEGLWRVAVDVPLPEALTYKAPTDPPIRWARGMRVHLPLGKRKASGVLLGPTDVAPTEFTIKELTGLDDEYPILPEAFLRWLEWLAQYYLHPVGQVCELAYPPLRQTARTRGSQKGDVVPDVPLKEKFKLNDAQATAVDAISSQPGFGAHLLFGVTGSGKTEVYLELLERTLAAGKSGLFLVPEIALTPQLLRRFSERFGQKIAVIHSQLTDRERTEQWWSIQRGEKKILMGARSAIFCPVPDLGLVVVDEEHEPSFKQEEKLKYHGRDAAIMLAKEFHCPVVLGSATPSLESWKNALENKFVLHRLPSRVGDQPLPHVEILDLRQDEAKEGKADGVPFWMTDRLHHHLTTVLEAGQQAALFLNRRGYSASVVCQSCGTTVECPNCDISLTLHGKRNLVCHYCNYDQSYTEECPACQGDLKPLGLGTEQVEEDLRRLFPQARVARADRDEIQSREDFENMVRAMEAREIDILVGTQMIAKGLDFPGLKFAGLVLADVGFNLPDFRSTERSFQLMTQMSGRAGRHGATAEDPGRVLIQTYNPDHLSLTHAPRGDYEGFAEAELRQREALGYPPYGRLAVLRIQSLHQDRVWAAGETIRGWIERGLQQRGIDQSLVEILGPAEAPLARIRRQYRIHMLLKSGNAKLLRWLCENVLAGKDKLPAGVKVAVDIDPLNLL
ncbi:MAG: primosomal protein N' [Bdellovibrionaceae bacterium]|nr:primosomal protein N' [Pseudobdellovibrionaceae bacterium]